MAVATALAVGGLITSAASTTASFIQAGKQKKLQRQAEADAQAAMDEARKKLEINYFEQMAIQKEPYELEREALLSQGAQAIQAGQESERGAAATAGRIQMGMNEAQAGIRTAMGKEMADIQKMQLTEESRLRDVGTQLDLAEAEGAQQAAAQAQQAAAQATAQGFQGLTSLASQGLQMVELYPGGGKKTADAVTAGATAPTAAAKTAAPTMAGQGQVPSSKLNVSPFTQKPTASMLAQANLEGGMGYYGSGSKLGSRIMMPSAEDAYNFFQFYK